MGAVPNPFVQFPPPPPPQKSNLPMLYYGLVVVATAAIVLAVYNLIIIKWCTHRPEGQPGRRRHGFFEVITRSGRRGSQEYPNRDFLSSFKYKKEKMGAQDQASDYECPVCLSVFEEGEEVRQLPRCRHSFHASCIDMWLYSHYDCPLCRAHVDPPPSSCHRHTVAEDEPQNSREGLLDSGTAA